VGSWFPLIPLKRVPLRAGGDTPGWRFCEVSLEPCRRRSFQVLWHGVATQRHSPVKERAMILHGVAHEFIEFQGLALKLDLVSRDAGHVQQVVDQVGQLSGLAVKSPPRRVSPARPRLAMFEDVGAVPDGGQRVAQFVREHRQEFVLALVGFAQGLLDFLVLGYLRPQDGDSLCRGRNSHSIPDVGVPPIAKRRVSRLSIAARRFSS